MARLILPIVSTFQFSVHREIKTLVAEVSQFRGIELQSRIYDDACDVGFTTRSHKTGDMVTWYMSGEKRSADADNELEVTIYKPISESARAPPAVAGWELHLIND